MSDNWISIDSSLPELHTVVLVYLNLKMQTGEVHFAFRDSDAPDWFITSTNGRNWFISSTVGKQTNFITHWQPLPPPPETKS